eukprot:scaffold11312_cov69-Phaeocystis_antarctica.AAC.9
MRSSSGAARLGGAAGGCGCGGGCDVAWKHLLHMPPVAGLPKKPHPLAHWVEAGASRAWELAGAGGPPDACGGAAAALDAPQPCGAGCARSHSAVSP